MFANKCPDTNYRARCLAIAGVIKEAVQGRLDSANERIEDENIDRMTEGMVLEIVTFPDFTQLGSDIERLSPRQVYLWATYKFREIELNNFIHWYSQNSEAYEKTKAVKSFMHRLRKLSEAINKLVQNWNSNALA